MNGRRDIRLAGSGGQGVVTAGRILAEAAMLSGRRAAHSQVYGPESRGGGSRSDVVISEDEIGFPLAESIDVLIILSGEAYRRYGSPTGNESLLVIDRKALPDHTDAGPAWTVLPIVDTGRKIARSQFGAGMVALGVLQRLTALVSQDALERALTEEFSAARRQANLAALAAGMELGGWESE